MNSLLLLSFYAIRNLIVLIIDLLLEWMQILKKIEQLVERKASDDALGRAHKRVHLMAKSIYEHAPRSVRLCTEECAPPRRAQRTQTKSATRAAHRGVHPWVLWNAHQEARALQTSTSHA